MIKKYCLFFLLLGTLLFSKSNIIYLDSLNYVNDISLSNKSFFAYSTSKENILPNNFYSYTEFKKIKLLPTYKVLWQKINIKNNHLDTLYIYSKSKIPKIELFKIHNNQLVSHGHSGFANHLKSSSVKGFYHVILFPTNPEGDFFIKITSERYRLNTPELYLSRFVYKINEVESRGTISLLTAGSQMCLVIICIIFIVFNFFDKFPKLLIYFLLIGFFDALYFLVRNHILILENDFIPLTNSQIWNIIGDINIILYYIFFIHFFEIQKRSVHHIIINIGILFWIGQIFMELSDFQNSILITIARTYLSYASVVDFMIMTTILLYVLRFRLKEKYFQIGFVGLFFMWLSALEIILPHFVRQFDWTNMDFLTFGLMQITSLINVFAVVAAFMYDYQIKEKERLRLKSEMMNQEVEKYALINRERERISNDMHDDLGAGISALKLQSEFLKKRVNDVSLKNDIEDLIRTTQDINISMREMLWSLNSSKDTAEALVQYITNYGEQFFLKSNIKFKSNIHHSFQNYKIDVAVRRNLFLCVKEAFNNCYKHSNATEVQVEFKWQTNQLIIEVKDNGKGFESDVCYGNGLRNMDHRMKESNGIFEIENSDRCLHLIFRVPISSTI